MDARKALEDTNEQLQQSIGNHRRAIWKGDMDTMTAAAMGLVNEVNISMPLVDATTNQMGQILGEEFTETVVEDMD